MKSSLPRRRLIPRWRPISKTLETSEIETKFVQATEKLAFNHDSFHDAVDAWRINPTAGHLGDVLAFSPDTDLKTEISTVLEEAIKHGHAVSETQKSIFSDLREEISEQDDSNFSGRLIFQSRVSNLRKELLVAPDNVLALLDLAQLQLAAGKQTAARRHILSALDLAPNGRIVLRTAARFFVHIGEYEQAHSLIARHPTTREDPWLMASEISLAEIAGRNSTQLNIGKRIIRTSKEPSRHLAELAGAVATRELGAGSLKEARTYFRLALQQPTDNIVAQAMVEAGQMGVKLEEPAIVKAVTNSSEAQLFQAWMALDENASTKFALRWHAEEPFSSRPLQFLAAVCALQSDYQKALQWVQQGLIADPADSGLMSNLCFIQAASGDVTAAENSLKRARALSMSQHEPFFKATEGLIALKQGEFDAARALYRGAQDTFITLGSESTAALCLVHYAKFAIECNAPDANALKQEAIERVKKNPSVDSLILLSKLLGESVVQLAEDQDQRRLSQWVFDPDRNTLTQKLGVTAKGAPAVVVKGSKVP